MKKLAIIFAAVVTMALTSCEKIGGGTTYTLIDHAGLYEEALSQGEGKFEVEYTYFIYEYTESGLRIATNVVDKPKTDKPYKFIASEDAYYLTVKWQMSLISSAGEVDNVYYLPNVFLLEKGGNVNIEIYEDTYFQRTEPK